MKQVSSAMIAASYITPRWYLAITGVTRFAKPFDDQHFPDIAQLERSKVFRWQITTLTVKNITKPVESLPVLN